MRNNKKLLGYHLGYSLFFLENGSFLKFKG